jgi:RHS repeat-associated protein
VTVDGVTLTYDALGRMVEQNESGVYYEIAYAPSGSKLAIMNGQTLTRAFVPLSGDSMAVYNSSGLAYYRHSDWLGSSRLASTPTRTVYFDGAYGPFGESYAQSGTTDLSFTGMNQDTVSNLFDFPAREYNDIHGRWPSPDPGGLSVASITDPQSLDRYGYVSDNPLSATDPSGLCPDTIGGCRTNLGTRYSSYACEVERACGWDPFSLIDIPVVAVGAVWTQAGGGGGFNFPGGWGDITLVGSGWAITSTIVGDAFSAFGGFGSGKNQQNEGLGGGFRPFVPKGLGFKPTGPPPVENPIWPTEPPPIIAPDPGGLPGTIAPPTEPFPPMPLWKRIVMLGLTVIKGTFNDFMICATCNRPLPGQDPNNGPT